MRKLTLEIKVGIMVVGAILLFMITVLTLGGDRAVFRKQYRLRVYFDAVNGLGEGSVVQLVGMVVGNVKSIQLAKNSNQVEVILKVNQKYQKRITEGSMGELRTQGALGDKYIFIKPGPPDAPPLQEGGILLTNPEGDLFSTIAKKGNEFKQIFEIITNLNILIQGLNKEGRSAKLVENLSQASGKLVDLLKKLDKMAGPVEKSDEATLKRAIAHLNSILEKIDSGEGTLGKLINDPSLHTRLKEILGGSKRNKYLKGLIRKSIKAGKQE
jgi:phospholipid/cholesterol/gamma-HCH transport system substrate-binding protein